LRGLLGRLLGGHSDSITQTALRLLGRLLGGHSDGATKNASRLEWLQLKRLVMDLMIGAKMPTGC